MAEQPSSFADARGARLREQARESRDHDLLSALVAIEGGLRALQARPGGAPDELVDALVREAAMARSLLAPTGPLTGAGDRDAARGHGRTDVGTLVRALAAGERARGSDVDVDAGHDLQANVATVRLHQALRNVLDNARRHAPGAPVRISAGLDGDAIAIRISDGGPGIPLDVLPTVTSRGVQAPGARAGSGLGLHVVSELVAEAGGTFSIESDHHGTTVVVHVPAAASTTPTASTRPSGTGAGR